MKIITINNLSLFLKNIAGIFAPMSHTHLKEDITYLGDIVGISGVTSVIEILEKTYPIGSIYISIDGTNPETLFGFGTLEQIQDTFLLSAGNTYSAGSTGGESEHALTIDEIPSHNHDIVRPQWYSLESGTLESSNSAYGVTNKTLGIYSDSSSIKDSGNGQSHNNMPPYLTVYMWKRIE